MEIDTLQLHQLIEKICREKETDESISLLLQIIKRGNIQPEMVNTIYLLMTCVNNSISLFKLLLNHPLTNPSDNRILSTACTMGSFEMVQLLLKDKRVNPSDRENYALVQACSGNYIEIVKLLLQDPRVNPSSRNNTCLVEACSFGKTKIVELILQDPRVDPSTEEYLCLINACRNGSSRIVHMLLADPRSNPIPDIMSQCNRVASTHQVIQVLQVRPRMLIFQQSEHRWDEALHLRSFHTLLTKTQNRELLYYLFARCNRWFIQLPSDVVQMICEFI